MSVQSLSTWMPIHLLQATLRWFGILCSCALAGVVAGAIAYAPLHLSPPVAATVSVFAGLIYGGMWIQQQRAAVRSPSSTARRWGWGLVLAPFAVILGAVALALFQLYSLGQFQPLTQDRVANFDRLARAIDSAYPYFDEKQIDWQAMVRAVRPQIEGAQSDDEYFHAIAALLADLNDGHTMLSRPYPQITRLGQLTEIEGQFVLMTIGATGEAAGLAVGDLILAIDGRDVEAAMANLPPQLRYGSTLRSRRELALNHVLSVQGAAQSVEVTVQSPAGDVRTVKLTPPESPAPAAANAAESSPLVAGKRLPSGIGYMHLGHNFGDRPGHDMVKEFDAVLDVLMDTPGLILDLRDNGGGSSSIANRIAGRFLNEPFIYGREYYRQRLPTRAWWRWGDRRVTPRPPLYTGEVVLLIDATTVSSGEEFVVSLVDSGRAQTVGRQTAGSTGNPMVFQLPGDGSVRFSTGDLRRIDGRSIEGLGIQPDRPVTWTLADVRSGRDPDLEAAEQYLLSGQAGAQRERRLTQDKPE